MSLFQCDKCGCCENTALSRMSRAHYNNAAYKNAMKEEMGLPASEPFGAYCSACNPLDNFTWHGKFPREFFPLGSMKTNREGNLVPKETTK